jgi:membrane-associated protease RseP (regulator of RpoE activity)
VEGRPVLKKTLLLPLIFGAALLLFGGVAAAIIASGDDEDDDGSDAVAAATATRTAVATRSSSTPQASATPPSAGQATPVFGEPGPGGISVLEGDGGVFVIDVEAGSDAAFAGIEEGDLILTINGDEIETAADLPSTEGEVVALIVQVQRDGNEETVILPLTAGLDGFDDLTDTAQDEVRALITNGTPASQVALYIDRIRSQNTVTGNVVSLTASELVVDTKSVQGEVTFAIDGDTAFYAPTGAGPGSQPAATIDDIKVGDLVFVVSMDGETADSVSSLGAITP